MSLREGGEDALERAESLLQPQPQGRVAPWTAEPTFKGEGVQGPRDVNCEPGPLSGC